MGTTAKALKILDFFNIRNPEIGLTQMAKMSGYSKPTTLRLMNELTDAGLLEQDEDTRNFRLGSAILRLANLREITMPSRSLARPIIENCVARIGETMHVSVLQKNHLNSIALEEVHSHALRVSMDPSEKLPLHATASGLAVLAFGDPKQTNRYLNGTLKKCTPETVTDPAAISAALDTIRARGWSESTGGFELGVHGMAAPIFDGKSTAVAAVSITMPASRLPSHDKDDLVRSVKNAARDITTAWGGILPANAAPNDPAHISAEQPQSAP